MPTPAGFGLQWRGMNSDDYNRQGIQALKRAQAALGIRNTDEFAKTLAERTGGSPSGSTYRRWLRGDAVIPMWAVLAAADAAHARLEDLLAASPDYPADRKVTELERTVNFLQTQVTELRERVGLPSHASGGEDDQAAISDVACAYVVHESRILMTQRRFPQGNLVWSPPTGKVESDESPEQAAVREVHDETGLTVEVTQRLGDRLHPDTGRHLIYFACGVTDGVAQVRDHEEIVAVAWCTLPEVEEKLSKLKGGLFEPVREYLMSLALSPQERHG